MFGPSPQAIAQMLEENSHLTHLELQHNNVGDAGLKHLAGALKRRDGPTAEEIMAEEAVQKAATASFFGDDGDDDDGMQHAQTIHDFDLTCSSHTRF
jgi:hypothetical protein